MYNAKKIDSDACRNAIIKSYDTQFKLRKNRQAGLLDNSFLELGHKTTLLDVPHNTVWQKDLYDQTGEIFPIGNYSCPRCGLKKSGSFPFEVCPRCGMESPLRKINYRR